MAGVTTFIEDIRKPFTSILGELLAMSAFPMALAAWATRRKRRDVEGSGWAPEELRIEDKRDEAAVTPQPMKPPREVVTDAETGEELVKVKPREYWRKRKGQKQKLAIEPEIPPDEKGVSQDGGSRIAMTAAGPMELPPEQGVATDQNAADKTTNGGDEGAVNHASALPDALIDAPQQSGDAEQLADHNDSENLHDTPPELSDDELAAIDAELAEPTPPEQAGDDIDQSTDGHADGGLDGPVAVRTEPDASDHAEPEGEVIHRSTPELATAADEYVNGGDPGGETGEADGDRPPAVLIDGDDRQRGGDENHQRNEDAGQETGDHRSTPETDPKRMIGVAAE